VVYRRTERSERVRAASRRRILGAAALLFTTQGYDTTTIQQIVSRAGTSTGNLYFYFANKEALLSALIAEAQGDLWRIADAALAEVPPGAGRLAVSIYVQVSYVLRHIAAAKMVLLSEAHTGLTAAAFAAQADRLRRLLIDNHLVPEGEDLELAISAWLGAVRAVIGRSLSGAGDRDPDQVGRFLARWNLRSIGLEGAQLKEAMAAIDVAISRRPPAEGFLPTIEPA